MKPCLVCGVLCAGDAQHCPNCGEASFGDAIDSAPNDSAESPAVDSAQAAPPNNQPRRDVRRGR